MASRIQRHLAIANDTIRIIGATAKIEKSAKFTQGGRMLFDIFDNEILILEAATPEVAEAFLQGYEKAKKKCNSLTEIDN